MVVGTNPTLYSIMKLNKTILAGISFWGNKCLYDLNFVGLTRQRTALNSKI